jgi:hypothetical protein
MDAWRRKIVYTKSTDRLVHGRQSTACSHVLSHVHREVRRLDQPARSHERSFQVAWCQLFPLIVGPSVEEAVGPAVYSQSSMEPNMQRRHFRFSCMPNMERLKDWNGLKRALQ